MKKLTYALIGVTASLAMLLSACNMENTASPAGELSPTAQASEAAGTDAAGRTTDQTAETPAAETPSAGTSAAAGTNAEGGTSLAAPQSGATLTFTQSGVTAVGGSGYEIDGTAVKITEGGVYTLTGSCADGSITVKKGTTGVTLVLSDLTLSSSDGAALRCNKESEVTLFVSGAVTLTDAEDPADETSADAAVADAFDGAAIKVKSGASLTITGSGVLNVDGSAVKNGIKGAEDAAITLSGATVNIKAAHNGLACDGTIAVTGGALNIMADNDAIHGETDVTISGGTVSIRAGDDAIHAEQTLTVGVQGSESGPVIVIDSCHEGFEAGKILLYSGSGSICADDDGMNAASDVTMDELAIYVYGGTWSVDAGGDGLDAGGNSAANRSGNICLLGGTVEVFGSADNGNSALDYDGSCTQDGGTLLAVGMSGMAQAPSSGVSVTFGSGGMGGMGGFGGFGGMTGQQGGSVSIRSGSTIEIRAADGTTLYTATGVKNANHVVFSSPDLIEGESYTLLVDGTAAATAAAAAGNGMGGMGGFGRMPGGQGQTPGQMPGGDGQTPGRMPGEDGQTPGRMPGGPRSGGRPGSTADGTAA